MAYVDDLLVVGIPAIVQTFLEQFKVRLELKRVSQLTVETPLEFLGKSIELQANGAIQLSFSPQYYGFGKILKHGQCVARYICCVLQWLHKAIVTQWCVQCAAIDSKNVPQ
eukprot:243549-Amphidinium_carterae.1